MFELTQITENSYYVQSPAKIGIYRINDSEVCFIDSGNDKDAGRRLRQILEANSWHLKAIYTTHSNADHIGGCQYLQKQTGCRVFAPGIECDFTNHPLLEPSFLYGGFPPKDLRHKFLMAQESAAEPLSEDVLPGGFEMIPLPGHFFDMTGYRTPDDVVFLADCLSSKETLEKYHVGYIYDVAAYLDTLEKVKQMEAKMFVPSHAAACEDIRELAQFNIDKVMEIAGVIKDICREPVCADEALKKLFDHYGLTLNFEQYVLVGNAMKSYLSWLKDLGEVEALFDNNILRWRTL